MLRRLFQSVVWFGLGLFAGQLQISGATNAMDLNPAEWKRTEWNNILFLSNAKSSKSSKIAEEVTTYLSTIGTLLPYPSRTDRWPLRIYICKDVSTFQILAPDQEKFQKHVAGLFTQGLGYDVIIIRADARQSQIRSVIFHELVHRELRSQGNLPLWLDEGLAEVYSLFRFKKKEMHYALLDKHHRQWISRNKLMSLSRLFHVTPHSPEYNQPDLQHAFYATSWAFTHYCLHGNDGAKRKQFMDFAETSRNQVITESTFKQHFGISYQTMSKDLLNYITSFRFPKAKAELPTPLSRTQLRWVSDNSNYHQILLAGATTLSKRYNTSRLLLQDQATDEDQRTNASRNDTAAAERNTAAWLKERSTLEFHQRHFESAHDLAEQNYKNGDRSPTTLILYAEKLLKIQPGERILYRTVISNKDVNRAFRCIRKVMEYAPRDRIAARLYVLAWLRITAEPSATQFLQMQNTARTLADDYEINNLTADLLIFHKKYYRARDLLLHFQQHTHNRTHRQKAQDKINALPI